MAHTAAARCIAIGARTLARAALMAGLLIPFARAAAGAAGPAGFWAQAPSPEGTETSPLVVSETPTPTDTPLGSDTPTASATPTETETLTPSLEPSATASASETVPAPSETPTATATESITPSPSPSPSATPISATPVAPGTVLIHEVAWAGTTAFSSDEWIELHNTGTSAIDLAGWVLSDQGDISIHLHGMLLPGGYFLLERTDDGTVSDVAAQQIYTGGLSNAGEKLELTDPSGAAVDTANQAGGPWPAGNAATRASMERRGSMDIPANWSTALQAGSAHDASGNPILGTPGAPNSVPPATSTPTPQHTPVPLGAVWINEVAWAGTHASASDEWIELHNPGGAPIDLAGWRLSDSGDISIRLAGRIPPFGFYLLERTDDQTISDVAADQIYSGGLSNSGETLVLLDPSGAVVDTANSQGGGWAAGAEASRRSMERRGAADVPGNWATFNGYFGVGLDSSGGRIMGTPRGPNSILFPTPTPTWIPGRVVINEVLPRARYDWEGRGGVTSGDEFIELYNLGPGPVFLRGWILNDYAQGGSSPYALPGVTISPGGFAVFFRTRSRLALNDTGDSIRLEDPSGILVDKVVYRRGSAVNLSYGRLPDASSRFSYCLWPTPGEPNELFVECRPYVPPPTRLFPSLPLDCSSFGRGGLLRMGLFHRRC